MAGSRATFLSVAQTFYKNHEAKRRDKILLLLDGHTIQQKTFKLSIWQERME
jgi:hypothetical protein